MKRIIQIILSLPIFCMGVKHTAEDCISMTVRGKDENLAFTSVRCQQSLVLECRKGTEAIYHVVRYLELCRTIVNWMRQDNPPDQIFVHTFQDLLADSELSGCPFIDTLTLNIYDETKYNELANWFNTDFMGSLNAKYTLQILVSDKSSQILYAIANIKSINPQVNEPVISVHERMPLALNLETCLGYTEERQFPCILQFCPRSFIEKLTEPSEQIDAFRQRNSRSQIVVEDESAIQHFIQMIQGQDGYEDGYIFYMPFVEALRCNSITSNLLFGGAWFMNISRTIYAGQNPWWTPNSKRDKLVEKNPDGALNGVFERLNRLIIINPDGNHKIIKAPLPELLIRYQNGNVPKNS
jgi:hypothetical protein